MQAESVWFTPHAEHRPRPRVIRRLQHRLRDYLHRPTNVIPSLAWVPIQGRERIRYQRYQRRQACIVVLQGLLHYLDVVSLRVGVSGDQVLGVRLDTLAEQTGMDPRRIDRAVRDLREAGLLASHKRAELVDARHIGHTSIRVVPAQLFGIFGLDKELRRERERIYAARSGATADATVDRRGLARVSLALRSAIARGEQGEPKGGPRSLADALPGIRPPPRSP